MSLKDLLALSLPVPGLDAAFTILNSTYTNIQNVKVYKQQCQDMSSRCVQLVLALREGMEDQESNDWTTELEEVLLRIDTKILEWASMGRLRSFLQQGDIQETIESFQREIDGAMMKYSISASLELRRGVNQSRAIQERDRAEIREVLETIVQSTTDMKTLLNMPSSHPVEEIMECLQTELMDPSIPEPQERTFREGLWYLHSRTLKLPPLPELTGQVTKESAHTSFIGTYNDVYKGLWLDREKVALRLPRNLPNKAKIQRNFEREVTVWRQLEHPNVLPLYGIARIGDHMYSVSPWMEKGTAISYVQECPDIDRLRLLSEIVAGLEYLHSQDIVHGDLRGANVLISDDGVARLADFGLSKFLGDCGQGMTSAPNVNPRWFAPELIRQTGTFSKESDIWSLSMTFLELLTGEQPFADIALDIAVLRDIDNGKTPNRPKEPRTVGNGLNDAMWSLIKKCWRSKVDARPTIQEVKSKLNEIRAEPASSNKGSRRLSCFSARSSLPSTNGRPSTGDHSSMSSGSSTGPRRPTIVVPSRGGSDTALTSPRTGYERPSTSGSSASGGSWNSGRLKPLVASPNDYFIDDDIRRHTPNTPSTSSPRPIGSSPVQSLYSRRDSRTSTIPSRPIPASTNSIDQSLRLPQSGSASSSYVSVPRLSSSPSSTNNVPDLPRRQTEDEDTLPPLSASRYNGRRDSKPLGGRQGSGSFLDSIGNRPTTNIPPVRGYSTMSDNASWRLEYQTAPKVDLIHLPSPSSSNGYFVPPTQITRSFDSNALRPVQSLFSTESASRAPSNLRDAILNTEDLVCVNQSGEVTAGTLGGLLKRLITKFNLRGEAEFRDVLLTASIDFISPEELFAGLAQRFEMAEREEAGEARIGVQHTILSIISYWLSSHHLPVNLDLLCQMKVFTQGAIQLKTSHLMIERGNDLLHLIQVRTKEQSAEEAQSTPFNVNPDRNVAESIGRPSGLAIALTILEGDKFKKLMPADYLANQRQPPITGYLNRVDDASTVNNHIIQWVKQTVLHSTDVMIRADSMKFFIATAQECRKLRNYGSLVAIAIALHSAPVERLSLTKSRLTPKMQSQLEWLGAILSPSDNHAAYRAALQEGVVDPQDKCCCIPWLAVHLKHIHTVLTENRRVVDFNGQNLINFQRYTEYVRSFKETIPFTPPDLEDHRDNGELAYLEHRLAATEMGDAADEALMAKCIAYEAHEAKMYDQRILERKSLGFSTRRKPRG